MRRRRRAQLQMHTPGQHWQMIKTARYWNHHEPFREIGDGVQPQLRGGGRMWLLVLLLLLVPSYSQR
jgi:hypothetical protein